LILSTVTVGGWIAIAVCLMLVGCAAQYSMYREDFWPDDAEGWLLFVVLLPWRGLQGLFWIVLFVVSAAFWWVVGAAVLAVVAVALHYFTTPFGQW